MVDDISTYIGTYTRSKTVLACFFPTEYKQNKKYFLI